MKPFSPPPSVELAPLALQADSGQGDGELGAYRALLEINRLPLLLIEIASGDVVEVNEAAVGHYGRTREKFKNFPITELWANGEFPRSLTMDDPAEVCAALCGRWRHQKNDGEVFDAQVSCRPLIMRSSPIAVVLVEEIPRRLGPVDFDAAISELGKKLSEAVTPREAGRIIADTSRHLIGWDAFHVVLHSSETGGLAPLLSFDTIDGVVTDCTHHWITGTSPSPLYQNIIEEGSKLVLRREGDRMEADLRYGDRSRRSESLLFVPIRKAERAVGVLSVQSYRRAAYSEEDLQVLEALASHCAGALERLQAASALRTAEQRFVKAFESSPMAMYIGSYEEGRALAVNPAFSRVFGFSAEEVIGRNGLELNFWHDPADRKELYQAIRRGSKVRDMQVRLQTKSGAVRLVLMSVEPIEVDAGRCLLFFNYDITERVNLEAQLRQSQKLESIGQVAAGVAHDFNNLLTVIEGCTSLALAGTRLDPESRDLLEQVASSAGRAANLTRQLLAFSSRQKLVRRRLNVKTLLDDLKKMLRQLLGHGILLEFRFAQELPDVSADSGMVEQVVVNMVVNARDAMADGGRFLIEAFAADPDTVAPGQRSKPGGERFVCLRMSDTGCGISPGDLPRLFEPFFTTKEVGKGSGLGLATSYGIVKQHGGWIDVESRIGEGTVFSIFLPVREGDGDRTPKAPVTPAIVHGKERVLVVEDEPAVRDLMCHILRFYGYETLQADSGSAALGIWEKQGARIDAMVTDMVMPGGMDGRELARLVLEKRPDLPVLYTSGYSPTIAGRDLVLRDGVNFLQKPFEAATLARALRNCIDQAGCAQ